MSAFFKSNIKKLTIPRNVRYIGAYAFSDSQITEIHFECKQCEFDHALFDRCRNIEEIKEKAAKTSKEDLTSIIGILYSALLAMLIR